jgi:hypothetical protein
MPRIALALGLALGLAACAAAPSDDAALAPPTPGDVALEVIGTPFLLAFKLPVCVVSAAIAAPLAGIAELARTDMAGRMENSLADGLERNCGPPYVVGQ